MPKVADYIIERLKKDDIRYVFGLIGSGTAVQLFDAIGRSDGIDIVCTLHEQSAGMAADAYANISGKYGVCIADSGPGTANLVTAVAGAYYNSNPVLYIVAQPSKAMRRSDNELRFYGFHENDVIGMFQSITKYVTVVDEINNIAYELEKSIFLLTDGRPGPVVLAIADDVTWLEYEPKLPMGYRFEASHHLGIDETLIDLCIHYMLEADKPLLMLGKGVICAGARDICLSVIETLGWPVALTWGARDLIPDNNSLYVGSIGNQGSRSGNLSIQTADFILSVGTRFDSFEIGSISNDFGRNATIISIEVDDAEIKKYETFHIPIDISIKGNAMEFFQILYKKIKSIQFKKYEGWKNTILGWRKKFPFVNGPVCMDESIDPYYFVECLSEASDDGDVFVTDIGASRSFIFQSLRIKEGQRLISWTNYSCLGYALPAAIGSSFAGKNRVISIMGDGGLQFNIQELATIGYYARDIVKIIIFDNGGFGSVEKTQDAWLEGRHIGTSKANGLPLPDIESVMAGYGFKVVKVSKNMDINFALKQLFCSRIAYACIVELPMSQWITPLRKGNDALEDMSPKLDISALKDEMILER